MPSAAVANSQLTLREMFHPQMNTQANRPLSISAANAAPLTGDGSPSLGGAADEYDSGGSSLNPRFVPRGAAAGARAVNRVLHF